jgi:hypothetical protein
LSTAKPSIHIIGTPKSVPITLILPTKAQINLIPSLIMWTYRDGFWGAACAHRKGIPLVRDGNVLPEQVLQKPPPALPGKLADAAAVATEGVT